MPTGALAPGPAAPGPGVDIAGRPVIDPTANVTANLDAAVGRLDDLRTLDRDWNIRYEEQRRYFEDLLRIAERGTRDAEKRHLDAVRTIDITAVARAADDANERANTLQTQVLATAEANRTTVAATATAFRSELMSVVGPLQTRIDELSKAQYEQQGGKQQVVESRSAADDMKPVMDAIQALTLAQQQNVGGKAQVVEGRATTNWIIGLVAAAALAFSLWTSTQEPVTPTPIVVEVPANGGT